MKYCDEIATSKLSFPRLICAIFQYTDNDVLWWWLQLNFDCASKRTEWMRSIQFQKCITDHFECTDKRGKKTGEICFLCCCVFIRFQLWIVVLDLLHSVRILTNNKTVITQFFNPRNNENEDKQGNWWYLLTIGLDSCDFHLCFVWCQFHNWCEQFFTKWYWWIESLREQYVQWKFRQRKKKKESSKLGTNHLKRRIFIFDVVVWHGESESAQKKFFF